MSKFDGMVDRLSNQALITATKLSLMKKQRPELVNLVKKLS